MPFTLGPTSGIYGLGTFGTAVYGAVSPFVAVDGVAAEFGVGVPTVGLLFTLPSLPLSVQVNDDVNVTGKANFFPVGLTATFVINEEDTSGVIFNFNAVSNDYSRKRTVYLPKADTRSDRTARTEERY